MVPHLAVLAKPRAIVYSPTSLGGYTRAFKTKTPAKPIKTCLLRVVYSPTRDSVLPSKKWCTPQQGIVYSLTNFGVLPNKKWCTG
jgi:hypothetical protein